MGWGIHTDLMPVSPTPNVGAKMSSVVCKRLDSAFNPKRVREWIMEGDREELQLQSMEFKFDSVDPLIRANRVRVLDIVSSGIVTLQTRVKYFALSYVMGHTKKSPGDLQSYSTNSEEHFTPFRHYKLPKTIQDAVELVRQIGERYLWVDALCILQDDPADLAAIIPEMGPIYGNAYLTIVAADGSDSEARLSRLSDDGSIDEWIPVITRKGSYMLSPTRPSLEEAIRASIWDTRGWTLQEYLLSRRCAIFTKVGVFFDSKALSTSEAYELLPNAEPTAHVDEAGSGLYKSLQFDQVCNFNTYARLLKEYTSRKLSYPGDRLDAFAGILRQLQPRISYLEHMNALSGLPSQDFMASLLWRDYPPRRMS